MGKMGPKGEKRKKSKDCGNIVTHNEIKGGINRLKSNEGIQFI